MGERMKGIMGSPFKRTSKYLAHQVFNRWGVRRDVTERSAPSFGYASIVVPRPLTSV